MKDKIEEQSKDEQTLGIPYARWREDTDEPVKVCPKCGEEIHETVDDTGELTSTNYGKHWLMEHEFKESKCEVCEQNNSVGVAAVPGAPVSVAWCKTCLEEGAYGPIWVAKSTILTIGGLENAEDWFKESLVFIDGKYVPIKEALKAYDWKADEEAMNNHLKKEIVDEAD